MKHFLVACCVIFPGAGCSHAYSGQDPNQAYRLPAEWQGTGVLARQDHLPDGAPKWAAIKAEVQSDQGARILRTTGIAEHMSDHALARSTAENRARAEMSAWLHQSLLKGARINHEWQDLKQKVYIVSVELLLPDSTLTPTR